MSDQSHLDQKYFIDTKVFNCPFCNRNNVAYRLTKYFKFDWSNSKSCNGNIVKCSSCSKESMHLSFEDISTLHPGKFGATILFKDVDLDSKIFYSVPTSFFVLDNRIPKILRELLTEAEGSLKMNFLTGASACMRKCIYELLVFEAIEGPHYDERIKTLKEKHSTIDETMFEVLGHIQGMTSDKVHEQSWDKWDANNLMLIIETLKAVLHEIYVLPKIKKDKTSTIKKMFMKIAESKKTKS